MDAQGGAAAAAAWPPALPPLRLDPAAAPANISALLELLELPASEHDSHHHGPALPSSQHRRRLPGGPPLPSSAGFRQLDAWAGDIGHGPPPPGALPWHAPPPAWEGGDGRWTGSGTLVPGAQGTKGTSLLQQQRRGRGYEEEGPPLDGDLETLLQLMILQPPRPRATEQRPGAAAAPAATPAPAPVQQDGPHQRQPLAGLPLRSDGSGPRARTSKSGSILDVAAAAAVSRSRSRAEATSRSSVGGGELDAWRLPRKSLEAPNQQERQPAVLTWAAPAAHSASWHAAVTEAAPRRPQQQHQQGGGPVAAWTPWQQQPEPPAWLPAGAPLSKAAAARRAELAAVQPYCGAAVSPFKQHQHQQLHPRSVTPPGPTQRLAVHGAAPRNSPLPVPAAALGAVPTSQGPIRRTLSSVTNTMQPAHTPAPTFGAPGAWWETALAGGSSAHGTPAAADRARSSPAAATGRAPQLLQWAEEAALEAAGSTAAVAGPGGGPAGAGYDPGAAEHSRPAEPRVHWNDNGEAQVRVDLNSLRSTQYSLKAGGAGPEWTPMHHCQRKAS